jgi:N-acetyl-gamma-glutamyl-phosphate reductase
MVLALDTARTKGGGRFGKICLEFRAPAKSSEIHTVTTVFIDGQAGTTGLQISDRLAQRADIDVIAIDEQTRKDPKARAQMFDRCDVAILCLPDDAAIDAVALANGRCRILDASTAHRIAPAWTYGLPELAADQRAAIAGADLVSNPGCYPQGFILMVRPLIESALLSADVGLSVHALSGYSGGGKSLIQTHRAFDPDTLERRNTEAYGLQLKHKHVPEMTRYSGTRSDPLFTPMVGHFYQGMLVQVPIFIRDLEAGSGIEQVHRILSERYADEPFISVCELGAEHALQDGFLNATQCNQSNRLEIMVFGHGEQMLLVARYDNLGKGASGAAVQNLNLMIGARESTGIEP